MLYLCQLDYPHVPYNHNVDNGGVPEERRCVKTSGCGLCCMSMVVDHLTTKSLPLEDCVKLSESCGANKKIGTNMNVLGPAAAELYGLEMERTDSLEEVNATLRRGGRVIVNVGGDREGYIGLFSYSGHFILLVSVDDDGNYCVLDPAFSEGRYDIEGRKGRIIRQDGYFVYCKPEEILNDTANRKKAFYMFTRK